MPISIEDVLNSAGEPTYRPSSEKISMSKINQPIPCELETSPPKTTTQHSHTNDSNHEANSGKEDKAGVNNDTIVVNEEVQAGDNPEDGSPNIEGSFEKILSTTAASDDQPSSTLADEVLSKIKENVFKGDLFMLLLADPYAPLILKALLNQVNLL